MKQLFCLTLFFLLIANGQRGMGTVTSGASTETGDLFNYLRALEGEYILSGQHNYGHELTRSTDSVAAIAGKQQQSKWTWFMIWTRFPWTHNTKEEIKALYAHPSVLALDELDN